MFRNFPLNDIHPHAQHAAEAAEAAAAQDKLLVYSNDKNINEIKLRLKIKAKSESKLNLSL